LKAYRVNLMVCAGTGCVANHSFEIKKALEGEIKKRGLENEVEVVATGCNGFCAEGPLMVVQPDGIFYGHLTEKDLPHLVEEHLLKGRPVPKLMYVPESGKLPIPKMSDIGFFNKQMLIALRNRGLIDPEKIDEAIGRGAYTALAKVLTTMSPEEVIKVINASGLRGRGGGGFPAGVKWDTCRKAHGEPKYVICNADEGDPGAFMDRSIIEGDPHAVLEGMLIGAYAIGSHNGYIYIRQEYPLARERLVKAIAQARDYGLLGDDILGSGFKFDIKVARGAGAFVCGESTALMASIEGRVGEPRAKYIHTVEHGLWNLPTCLNNVETWATVPVIVNKGADWFTAIGTGDVSQNPWGGSKGTKVFSLTGKIRNTGLVEVPMGISLREIIFDIGGGIPGDKKFKSVQTGGPSGGFLPSELLDLQVDFEQLTEAGSMMGSGGMVVMDEDNCIVDMAKYFLSFTQDESCGKCTPCREGTLRMLETLQRITEGKGEMADIQLLDDLSHFVIDTSLCALGGSAPNPALTSIRYFRDEYISHIVDKKCPARVCRQLNVYTINPDFCMTKGHGCGVCRRECPEKAITGEKGKAHVISQELCKKCGVCVDVCKFDSVAIS